MPEQDLTAIRQKLLAERAELVERIRHFDDGGLAEPMGNSVDELSSYDNHPADLGSEMFERGKDLALRENAKIQLMKVDEALKRLEEGRYGICEHCGQPIPSERLEAVPTASLCLNCKANEEPPDRSVRPVEEDVVELPFGQRNYDLEGEPGVSMYDGEDAWQEVARYSEHAWFSRAGAYYGPIGMEEEDVGAVEDVEKIPYVRGKDGMLYKDFRGLDDEDIPLERTDRAVD
ncbi:MAG: conjugal transfer protein TraR [Firmicutes bacterium]|nr:conjugal transfer protein TraR [Bacillota bacterium]